MTEKDRHNGEKIILNLTQPDNKPRQPYQVPRLVKFGDLRTITLAPTFGENTESGYGDSVYEG